ncbi:MAG: MBL fold metallo-hydrolase, partial [Eubacterium sp.]|nr:MBL fold metallo-hydrolase [Eubacterium sp.]
DIALATHLHTDHYLGLEQLSECYRVRNLVTKGKAGDVIELSGGDRIEILWPRVRDPDTDDENENSLIFKVYAGGLTILVTGDLTAEGEKMLVERYRGTGKLKCDILKVCHHGSRFSSSEEFIDEVSPRAAVIGVGKNSYGHPAPETLVKFKARGIPVYRTDMDGAVGFRMDRGELAVCKMR